MFGYPIRTIRPVIEESLSPSYHQHHRQFGHLSTPNFRTGRLRHLSGVVDEKSRRQESYRHPQLDPGRLEEIGNGPLAGGQCATSDLFTWPPTTSIDARPYHAGLPSSTHMQPCCTTHTVSLASNQQLMLADNFYDTVEAWFDAAAWTLFTGSRVAFIVGPWYLKFLDLDAGPARPHFATFTTTPSSAAISLQCRRREISLFSILRTTLLCAQIYEPRHLAGEATSRGASHAEPSVRKIFPAPPSSLRTYRYLDHVSSPISETQKPGRRGRPTIALFISSREPKEHTCVRYLRHLKATEGPALGCISAKGGFLMHMQYNYTQEPLSYPYEVVQYLVQGAPKYLGEPPTVQPNGLITWNPHKNHRPLLPPQQNNQCFFCGEEGHFIRECIHQKKMEAEGWIYKPNGIKYYFLRNSVSLASKAKAGIWPAWQVWNLMEKTNGKLPPEAAAMLKTQNFIADGENDMFSLRMEKASEEPEETRLTFIQKELLECLIVAQQQDPVEEASKVPDKPEIVKESVVKDKPLDTLGDPELTKIIEDALQAQRPVVSTNDEVEQQKQRTYQ
ncbi:hypothetical protein BDZ89DRAFT_1044265 [Hymenopellis radicata]|nr:hypothetical protein BDZ89DRAFT_1044265 [Hymenopellis radicata]